MALDNIFVEPRREITETVVGLGAALAVWFVIYWAARWFVWLDWITWSKTEPLPVWFAMMLMGIVVPVGFLLSLVVLGGIHALGEGVCAVLDKRGLKLRPTQRYQREQIWKFDEQKHEYVQASFRIIKTG